MTYSPGSPLSSKPGILLLDPEGPSILFSEGSEDERKVKAL